MTHVFFWAPTAVLHRVLCVKKGRFQCVTEMKKKGPREPTHEDWPAQASQEVKVLQSTAPEGAVSPTRVWTGAAIAIVATTVSRGRVRLFPAVNGIFWMAEKPHMPNMLLI